MLLPKAFEFDEGSVCSTSGELTVTTYIFSFAIVITLAS